MFRDWAGILLREVSAGGGWWMGWGAGEKEGGG